MNVSKKTKMSDLLHYRLRVSSIDGRSFTGELLAFDGHLNLVLANAEEGRYTKKAVQELKKNGTERPTERPAEQKRSLGLVILRGEQIVGLSIESPPPTSVTERLEKGTGTTKAVRAVKAPRGFRRQ